MNADQQTQEIAPYKIRINAEDQGSFLLLLYQGAIEFLNEAKNQLEKGDLAQKAAYICQTHAIISEFLASLDFEVGGELARNLESLYLFMLDQLTTASINNDSQPLETVITLLSTLKGGWEEAVGVQQEQSAQQIA